MRNENKIKKLKKLKVAVTKVLEDELFKISQQQADLHLGMQYLTGKKQNWIFWKKAKGTYWFY